MDPLHARRTDRGAVDPLARDYTMHVLPTLDGVLLYLTLRGEHAGTFFGPTEHAAAAAAAAALVDTPPSSDDEA